MHEGTAFRVHACCSNCMRARSWVVPVPADADDAPQDVEEFLESSLLASQKFHCPDCDSSIATLTAVTMEHSRDAA